MNEDEKLIQSLNSLKESIDTSNSWRRTLLLGVVRGVGAVIGASILAGLLLGWAAATFDSFASIPLVGEYFVDMSTTVDKPTQ